MSIRMQLDVADLQKRVGALEQRPAETVPVSKADLEALLARVSALEARKPGRKPKAQG